ncbi:phospholipase D family protein [Silicimonas sp. MF1-12-2]|uniref:phospholipase D family protein n=1 Tax=Silicimonas sp. MF1-12-2 TaxID=3384793 RepID=UPI0039B368B5
MRWFLKLALSVVAIAAVAILSLRLLYPLPDLPDAETGGDWPALGDTDIGRIVEALAEANPGTSGVLPLERGTDAFAARVLLIRTAARTIDAQYYIWQDDLTGIRLLSELQDAAMRGVRVRLLVDDNGTPDLDQELAALDALPTAEVRVFNPFTMRDHRILNYTFDFFRLNRRMHNKSLTADAAATIVGGRNIGDVYFETGSGHTYLDLDVLAVGPAAMDVSEDFERYWFSGSSHAISSLVEAERGAESLLAARDAELRETEQARAYSEVVRQSPIIGQLMSGELPLEWVPTLLFSDDPGKGLGLVDVSELMIRKLMTELGPPQSSFDIVSAYFITGETATEHMAGFASEGVRVRTLTNSLEATDVAVVHAGYINYRDALIDGGVEVYELRSDHGARRAVNDLGMMELSRAALHAKTFAMDGRRAFIGSLNFDPRSRRLNTEMGFLIDSPRIAGLISGWMDETLRYLAYRVSRDEVGGLLWTAEDADGGVASFDVEPNTTVPLRLLVTIASYLPVEWML